MSVPSDDTLCRFVRPRDWSRRDRRPKPGAFKQSGLSVWNCRKLHERGVRVDELRIGHLAGYGQAHHTAGDYLDYARDAERRSGDAIRVSVIARTDDEYVEQGWRKWRYAHVQVEAISGPDQFTPLYRGLLATNCRYCMPPDE